MKHIALGELGTVPMIHFPKEMVSRSEKFGTVPVFQILRSATTTPYIWHAAMPRVPFYIMYKN